MINYTSDKHRCEIFFLARIWHVVAITGVKFDTEAEHDAFIIEAWEAVLEPTNGLYGKHKETIRRRVQRMEQKTLRPACEKSFAEKIILIGYHFLNELQERDYIKIPNESKLMGVADHLLAMIDLEDEVTQKRMVSSAKQANRWLMILQGDGYFK